MGSYRGCFWDVGGSGDPDIPGKETNDSQTNEQKQIEMTSTNLALMI